jgi:hypothetical protein
MTCHDKFFEQHAKRFHHHPFIWHVWDVLKDGFAALVNYHQLDTKNLKRRLELILEGEFEGKVVYDIFVRWKPLAEQPIGWEFDLNDGVRMNIRPSMTADVLRHNKKPKLNITWDENRGKDVESTPWLGIFGGERINDHHLTLDEKHAAHTKLGSS